MQIINWDLLDTQQQEDALSRPPQSSNAELRLKVAEIVQAVREQGDQALLELTEQIDQVKLANIKVTEQEFNNAFERVDVEVIQAVKNAIGRIETFHAAQKQADLSIETAPGVVCQSVTRAIQKVGLYAPAGTAPLPSSVMMSAVPAKIAGCKTIVLCSPADQNGEIDPVILVTARLCGVQQVYKLGGALAVAAMAFGTDSVTKVDKIFGPGNTWLTEAKQQVSADPSGAAIDMPAGPSEVLVVADQKANPNFVAADLLSQAEHGVDSQSILLCDSEYMAHRVKECIEQQIQRLSRKDIIEKSLLYARLIIAKPSDFAEIVNRYAPEHLILQINEADSFCEQVDNAGSVFIGDFSPEAIGDYCSGTNHVLPTYGYARNYSGLSLASFTRKMSIQSLTKSGLENIGPDAMILADVEGLEAHKNAVAIRLEQSQ
ncbi:MAG: histidinol dehydrogenase [bacterium]